jgi:hypothetical protein
MRPPTERSPPLMAHLMAVQFVSDLTSDSRVGPGIDENRLRLSEQAADHRPLARLKICRLGVSDLARTDRRPLRRTFAGCARSKTCRRRSLPIVRASIETTSACWNASSMQQRSTCWRSLRSFLRLIRSNFFAATLKRAACLPQFRDKFGRTLL